MTGARQRWRPRRKGGIEADQPEFLKHNGVLARIAAGIVLKVKELQGGKIQPGNIPGILAGPRAEVRRQHMGAGGLSIPGEIYERPVPVNEGYDRSCSDPWRA